ncbi:MAG: hypothetical protein Q9159_003737 [Coniocarpon cinnabarinum]
MSETLYERFSSPDSRVLADPASSDFQKHHSRWTHMNYQTPAAIILPATEPNIPDQVKHAHATNIPFVVRSGGHSDHSTIASPGIIIDLSNFSNISVDTTAHTATLTGGILTGAVANTLADHGLFTALPNSHALGAIPYFTNGGNSLVNSLVGFASDQIISARVITASGSLLSVGESENTELLYAIRGAGPYFALVTQVTIRVYPFKLLGSDDGALWTGTFIFPTSAASSVANALETVLSDDRIHTAGSLTLATAPPTFQPALITSVRLYGSNSDEQASQIFAPFHALKPLVTKSARVKINELANAYAPFNVHGDFKRLRLAGFNHFPRDNWIEIPKMWLELIENCPDAKRTAFILAFDSRAPAVPSFESAIDMKGIRFWQTNFLWYSQEESAEAVEKTSEGVIEVMRRGQIEGEYRDLPSNWGCPLARRHSGSARLGKLGVLKRKWDETGVFGKQFLENQVNKRRA